MVIDSSYLGYRAAYAMRDVANPIYGFLSTIQSLRDRFDCDNFVFCFDHDYLKRQDILPEYKERRRDSEHEEEHKQARTAIHKLRKNILPSLGFKNILIQEGYEADDLIASVVENLEEDDEAVIISSDSDLYQLLDGKRVIMYHPSKEQIYTERLFSEDYFGLAPDQWPQVKAIAGCNSDNIKGIPGVGEKSAAKFLTGQLPFYSKKTKLIHNCKQKDYLFRYNLVKLPMEGTKTFKLRQDKVNWRNVSVYTDEDD